MMKRKTKSVLLVFAILFLMIQVRSASAFTVKVTNPIANSDINKLVANALQWLLSVAGAVALVALIYGGIVYITSAGSEERATSGKKIITWAILGLALVLASYALISVLNTILTA